MHLVLHTPDLVGKFIFAQSVMVVCGSFSALEVDRTVYCCGLVLKLNLLLRVCISGIGGMTT